MFNNHFYQSGKARWKIVTLIAVTTLFILPTLSFANSSIANAVASACAPNPTVPDVGSCSSCHSTTNNRGRNDLTAAGQWALSSSTYMNFCPTSTPTPPPAPTPTPTPTPTPPPGMSPTPTPPTMGMGSGASADDDDMDNDDDEHEADDDDDGGSRSGSLRSLRRSLSSFRRGGDD